MKSFIVFGAGEPWGRHQLWLVGLRSLAAFGVLGTASLASGHPVPWPAALWVLLLAAISVIERDTWVPLILWASLMVLWALIVPGMSWWSLGGAVFVLVGHVSTAYAALGPQDLTLPAATVRLVIARCAVILLITAGLTLAATLASGAGLPGSQAATAAALVLIAAWIWLHRSRAARSNQERRIRRDN